MLKCEFLRVAGWTCGQKLSKPSISKEGPKFLPAYQVPAAGSGCVSLIDDFKIKVNCATETLNFNR